MQELPSTLKRATVWLLLGTALFLGVQAWLAQRERPQVRVADGVIELQRAPDRHFHWPGTVNGQRVEFLVDTGATRSALPESLARRLGLPFEGAVQSATAGGTVTGWQSRVNLSLDGGVTAERLPVTILPGLDAPLLGMDVLARLHFSQQGGVLRLQAPR
jgi:aspartyl protease family protein